MTVATSQLLDWLRAYMEKEKVELVVVGEPWQTNGKPSENLPRVRAFVRSLNKAFPELPVVFYDERFT